MEYRELGRTGWKISTVSFGAWAIGGTWGDVDDNNSLAALHAALDAGVNFFDTADVYGDGRSERLLARLRKERSEKFYVATKCGRKLSPHAADGYNKTNLNRFIDESRKNLETDCLDLVQLHCPVTDVYYRPEVFGILDDMITAGKIKHYGVSVEKVEEALKAIEFPNVQSVQIIFNIFRQRPADLFFSEAKRRNVGILARLPLSSGMLTGKFSAKSSFANDDHRSFNRNGEAFDKGETFSGIDFAAQLRAIEQLKDIAGDDFPLARMALRWILMFPEVTCAIPGGKNPAQVKENVGAADLPPLQPEKMAAIRSLYEREIKPLVHQLW